MVMFKKIKSFEVVFNDPEKVYGSGEKVAGRVMVEVCEVTRVKAVRILACGVAKVLWMQGSQQCKQTLDYLRYEDTLLLEDQPTGTAALRRVDGDFGRTRGSPLNVSSCSFEWVESLVPIVLLFKLQVFATLPPPPQSDLNSFWGAVC